MDELGERWHGLIRSWIELREQELGLLAEMRDVLAASAELLDAASGADSTPAVPALNADEAVEPDAVVPADAAKDESTLPVSPEGAAGPAAHALLPAAAPESSMTLDNLAAAAKATPVPETAPVPEGASVPEAASVPENASVPETASAKPERLAASAAPEHAAVSTAPEHAAASAAPENTAAASAQLFALPQAPLVLVGEDPSWVGFPWDRVERVALAEEVPLPEDSRSRYSLGSLLGRSPEEEPYALLWTQEDGLACLSCARIGGVVTMQTALARGVERVVRPARPDGETGPELVSMPEFVAALHVESAPDPVEEAIDGPEEPIEEVRVTPPDAASLDSPGTVSESVETMDLVPDRDQAVPHAAPATAPPLEHPSLEPPVAAQAEPDTLRTKSALLAIHYLPARVAVGRSLRAEGWSIEEMPQLSSLSQRLENDLPEVLFVELSELLPESSLDRLRALAGGPTRVVAVGSRLRPPALPPRLGDLPRLHFPFSDEEIRLLLAPIRR